MKYKEVKFDGTRWWLYSDHNHSWYPFNSRSQPKLIKILMENFISLDVDTIYRCPDPKDVIYGQNHDVDCTGLWPKDHYECGGTGVIATFSDL